MDRGKTARPQPTRPTSNGGMWKVREIVFPQRRAHRSAMQYKMVIPENMQVSGSIQDGLAICMKEHLVKRELMHF